MFSNLFLWWVVSQEIHKYASSVSQYFLAIFSSHNSHVIFYINLMVYFSQLSVFGFIDREVDNIERKDILAGFVDYIFLEELLRDVVFFVDE